MNGFAQFRLLVGLRARAARRWLVDNGFQVFVMAPLVIGGAGLIFQPYASAIADELSANADALRGHAVPAVVALVFVGAVVARFASTVRDVFAVRPDEFYVDGLPVRPDARFHELLVLRLSRAVPLGIGALFVVGVTATEHESGMAVTLRAFPAVAYATVLLAVVEIAAALLCVRMRITRPVRLGFAAASAGAIAVAASGYLVAISAVTAVVSYAFGAIAYRRWRMDDRERAREALARARRSHAGLERLADRLLGPRIGAQLARDVRLVRRGFSSSPYLAFGSAAVFPLAAVWLCNRYTLGPVAAAHAIETATVLSAFALASITHALVTYERSRVWIDLAGGVEPDEFPKAKIWLGRTLALPAVVFGVVAVLAAGVALTPRECVELLWLWWSTATLTSVFCYELADRPNAGLVLAFIASAGDALLVVFYTTSDVMWYFGPFLYVYAMSNMLHRAGLKAAARS